MAETKEHFKALVASMRQHIARQNETITSQAANVASLQAQLVSSRSGHINVQNHFHPGSQSTHYEYHSPSENQYPPGLSPQ
jgi:hypothetical protein